jgi:hypothetical protein
MHYTHDQHTAKALAIAVVLFFAASVLTGCVKPATVKQERQPTLAETLGNMSKTGKAIACVFAPWHEECQRLKDEKVPHQTQEEYIKEVNEDFDDLDKEIEKSKSK